MTDELYKRYENSNFWISNYGNVYNTKSKRLCQGYWNKNRQYFYFEISKKMKLVHRLVFELFGEEPIIAGMQIDHKDGKRANNHISNLRQVTRQENMNNRHKGLHPTTESQKKTLKKYYEKNKEKYKEYYQTNKEEKRKYQRERYHRNKNK